ncbi:FtsH protease activity modulator HflK [Paracoccus siganidrum]|uniref:Protein HflK n=1 Tax=Paracoccus siganidrum TaxID=1276757 RepID=A0A419A3Y9_9RHOB|nr:FtsH protease activity modulator HflK [Paracoccus siganidrum]RJL08638.1 FtsH protease activity modulator HflK [Paracoccus siganidrum]RMC36775.1 FtsH protease activity modulator HflK [Paracoccus siganidrum]
MANQGPWGGGGNGGGDDDDRGKRPTNRPWGDQQPPKGSRRPGPGDQQMPEIEELMKKGQERLRVLMGGRGGGGSNGGGGGGRDPLGPGFGFNRRTLAIAGLVAVGLWAFSSFYRVQTNEKSVEFLFGRAVAVGTEGLNFAPWPVVTAEVVQVTNERVTEIGTGRAGPMDSGLMLTRDQNIVDMEYQVVWNISDPEKYLFNLADPGDTIRAVAESAMRDIIARSELAPILNRDRGAIANDLQEAVQRTLDAYQSGISVIRVNLDRADPPGEVIDSFREVQAAQQERDRLEKEADAYANRVLASARGEAAAMLEQAEAYRAQAVNTAEGEAARFNSVYEEYVKAPDVTRRRMYLETMEKVLGDVDKIILTEQGEGSNIVPYLPLDQLRRTPPPQGNTDGGSN